MEAGCGLFGFISQASGALLSTDAGSEIGAVKLL
jgi:hypothetical protein